MKKVTLIFIAVLFYNITNSQVGIGNTDPKVTLHISGKPTDNTAVDGVILPKLTGNELKAKDLIYTADQLGAMVYVTAAASPTTAKTANVTTAGYYYYDGSVWLKSNSNLQVGYKTIAAAYPTIPSKGDIVFTTSDGTVAGTKYRIETYDGTNWVNDKGVYSYIVTLAYAAGDIVNKDGLLYESNAAIPANTAFAIGTIGATWKAIGLSNTSETGSASVSQNPLGGTAGSPTVLATFTLPSAGTYELKYNLRVANTAIGTVAFTWFRNSAGIMIADSYKETWNGNNNSMVTTASSSVFVTVTTAESYTLVGYGTSMEIRLGSNLTWNKIAGFLPVANYPTVPNWTDGGNMTIEAITTAPTKPTVRIVDKVYYKQIGPKTWQVEMVFEHTSATGASNGNGDYLITLPNGLTFDQSIPSQAFYTGSNPGSLAVIKSLRTSTSALVHNGGSGSSTNIAGGITPYDATRFRVFAGNVTVNYSYWSSGWYGIVTPLEVRLSFTFQSAN